MWIVRLALRRPYTFIVGAILIVILGVLSILRMPTDVFPPIDIPVISLIWQYSGLSAEEMERRIATSSERGTTTTVNDIEHIESQSLNGVSVIKLFFQPGAKIEAAVAQAGAISQLLTRNMPPGVAPPFIIRYNASDVPVLQTAISGPMSEQELYDIATNQIRTRLATVRGATIPAPYGGRNRAISVDLDPAALYARGITPQDVSNAINAQNVVLPAGSAKIGDREYSVRLNGSPDVVKALNDIPIKMVNGAPVYLRDVAQVRDGYTVQTNIVRHDGVRGAMISALKSGGGSTIDVVKRIRETVESMRSQLPASLKIEFLADQAVFVRASLASVIKEALTAAMLTAAMILLFLGSWRSTLIVALSIPLAILTSLLVLYAIGQTINVMTLGGLALAVGVLVDDATVEIENIHRNQRMGKDVETAILDGAQQIAVPTFVSTLSICIVFVPVFFLTGAAKSLFAPLAMAVIFAMLASYLISRTVVPTLVKYALHREARLAMHAPTVIHRAHHAFDVHFERMRERYRETLARALHHRRSVSIGFAGFAVASLALVPLLGRDFFPSVDAGQIRVHLRAPAGTRLEETERITARVERTIREVIPSHAIEGILDNIGITSGSYSNLAASDNPTIGVSDGEIHIALTEERDRSTRDYVKALRTRLNRDFPDVTFFFQAADIVGQILNFGLPAPIDVQVVGSNKAANFKVVQQLARRMQRVPGAADVHVHQVANSPELFVSVDRVRAGQFGLTERDVASNLLVSLSGTGQTSPNQWLNPANGVSYNVSVMTPQYRVTSMDAITSMPLVGGGAAQLFGNFATIERRQSFAVVNHYNVQTVFDVYANVQGRDLGGVADDVDAIVAEMTPTLPKGSSIVVRGQVASMRQSFTGLELGLLFAVVLVYLLMVVNFQSWMDPLIIIMALPGALAGIVWILFATQTTLSVPSLMGAIMSMGVATANSVLIVSFANEQRAAGLDAMEAALAAGYTRLRPVIMTASAMIIGMLPMALGLGEGGEQNAPLGRAVIGGLLLATVATLFFVPVVYSALRADAPVRESALPPTAFVPETA